MNPEQMMADANSKLKTTTPEEWRALGSLGLRGFPLGRLYGYWSKGLSTPSESGKRETTFTSLPYWVREALEGIWKDFSNRQAVMSEGTLGDLMSSLTPMQQTLLVAFLVSLLDGDTERGT